MISFAKIPPNLRVPLAYFEVDPSQAATQQQQLQLALMLGAVPAAGSFPINTPTLIRSADEARGLFGAGTSLARMASLWFRNNQTVPLYALAASNATFGEAEGEIEVAGPATGAGTVFLRIGGVLVRVNIAANQTAAQCATAIASEINATPDCGAKATATAASVALTAIEPGTLGNLKVDVNYRGPIYGEVLPPGLRVTTTDLTGGTGSPNIATLLAFAGEGLFDFLLCPWSQGTDLDAIDEWLDDTAGRWAWLQQLYGHGFVAREGTVAALSTFGNTRNGQHATCIGYPATPSPPFEILAAWVGQCAGSLIIDPARPVHTLPLIGVIPPRSADRFTVLERQILYFDGISAFDVDAAGTCLINRCITTYQRNAWGAPDNSYLDVETMFTLAYFNRFSRDRVQLKFPRHKLANDGTAFGAGQAIVTPSIIRAEMVAAYGELEDRGLVENADLFNEHLIVERNATDPNRVDALLPPDFVNQLRILAGLTQFRLQFAAAA